MVPRKHATQRREHALAIGKDGFVATQQNVLSECASFGLQRTQAQVILDNIEATVQARWKDVLLEQGLTQEQAREWATCFRPLPQAL